MVTNVTLNGDEQGATAIEYGLIVGLIALGLVGSLVATKTSLSGVFNRSATAIGSPSGSASVAAVPTVANASTADGQPGVAKLDFASKGPYVRRIVYTGCDLGRCGMPNTTQYRFADGSSINYQPGGSGSVANYTFLDTSGTTTRAYYFTSPSGNGATGDTLTIDGVIAGTSFEDTLSFKPDGTVTGNRAYASGGVDRTTSAPTTQMLDYDSLYAAAAFAQSLQ